MTVSTRSRPTQSTPGRGVRPVGVPHHGVITTVSDIEIEERSASGIRGIVTLRIWSVPDLKEYKNNWKSLSQSEKLDILSNPSDYPVSPLEEHTSTNMVLDNYLELLAAGETARPTHLALGDGTTSPQGGNDSLNNEVYRTIIGQDESSGRDRLTSTLISQNEANGQSIREIGFTQGSESDNWTQLTHTVLTSTDQIDEKTSNMAVTIDYILEYRRVS